MREQRLLTGLLVSFTLHTAFLAFVPPLLSRSPSSLKRPLWVDLVELKEPDHLLTKPATPASAPEDPPEAQRKRPDPQAVLSRQEEASPRQPDLGALSAPDLRPLPAANELIPSMNSLLSPRRGRDNPLNIEPLEGMADGIHRGPEYEAYLRDIKEAVKKNWKVSWDGESKIRPTVLRMSINPDGSLASLDLVKSCGKVLHDYEALEASKQSFPLRSPPESLLDENRKLSIRLYFHYLLAPQG